MSTVLDDEVFLVYYHILEWEDLTGKNLFVGMSEGEESAYMLMKVAMAVYNGNPPDRTADTRGWVLFILNEFVEFAADFGINNIKEIITTADRNSIADATLIKWQLGPSNWPQNNFVMTQEKINALLAQFDVQPVQGA